VIGFHVSALKMMGLTRVRRCNSSAAVATVLSGSHEVKESAGRCETNTHVRLVWQLRT
jgi:hypothetical protein